MHSATLLSAAAILGASLVSAKTCTKDIEISEPTPSFDCEVVDADITISPEVAGDVVINGPKQIKGDLIITNATGINSVSSDTINAIGGKFELSELEKLTNFNMPSLRSLNDVTLHRLPILNGIRFGTSGLTRVSSVTVSDTNLNDLSGFNVASVDKFLVDNNRRLTMYESDLESISERFIISNNGKDMEVSLDKLETAAGVEFSGIKSISVPELSEVNGTLNFYDCDKLETFSAPKLTKIAEDISFINNNALSNLSFPALTKISGGLSIHNNAKLIELNGFPKLETISGGLNVTGDFEEINMPSLEDVQGSSSVASSTDIEDFCAFFEEAKSDGRIRGVSDCTSDEPDAATDEGGKGGSKNNNDNEDDDNAAGINTASMTVVALAAIVGLAQLL